MLRFNNCFTPLWSLFFALLIASCGKVDTPNVADPFANLKGKSLGFDVDPPYFDKDSSGFEKGLDSATPGTCGNGLLQWAVASDLVSKSNAISYLIYQSIQSGKEDFSSPTYQVPPSETDRQNYLVNHLLPNKTYYFVVRARDEAGNLSVIDPNHLVERSLTTVPTRGTGSGPNLYCPGGYAGERMLFTGSSVGNVTAALFPTGGPPVSVTTTALSPTNVEALVPSGIQSGPVQLLPPGGVTADRFLYFPPGLNISSDASSSSEPAIAVSGTNVGIVWSDTFQGKERIFSTFSTDSGGTFSSPSVILNPNRFNSYPQIAYGTIGNPPPLYMAWSDMDATGNNNDIYFSSTFINSTTFGATVNLSFNGGSSLNPRIAVSANSPYPISVVWEDNSTHYGLTSVWGSAYNDVYVTGFEPGKGGDIYYTADQGQTWIKKLSQFKYNLKPIALNGVWGSSAGDVYAVGTGGAILHSNDKGLTWATTNITSATLNGIWGSGISDVYAVGDAGTILHFDGNSWASVSGISNTINLKAVWGSAANDVYVVGSGGNILHFDGATWNQSTYISGANLNAIFGISPTDIYIAGDNGTVLHSTGNGIWSGETSGITTDLKAVWGTTYTPTGTNVLQEAIYASGVSDKMIKKAGAYPISSIVWDTTSVAVSGNFTVNGLWGVLGPEGFKIYGAQGDGPILLRSGTSWQYVSPDTVSAGEIFYVQSSNGGSTFTAPLQLSSASKSNHRASNPEILQSGNNITVAWNESQTQIVAVGAAGTILSTTYGTTWATPAPVTAQPLYAIAWSGSQLIAVGGSGTILSSPDGNSWTVRTSTTGNSLYGVVWTGSQFVAVGEAGTLLSSQDGTTWNSLPPVTSNALNGIAWSGSRYVAVGAAGTILNSVYGTTWATSTPVTSNSLNSVIWSGNQFVAVGAAGTILTSTDGSNWTSILTPPTSNALNAIASSGGRWVAVGSGGTIVTSYDATTWTSITASPVTANLQNILWDGAQFMAVGAAGALITSPNGVDWTAGTPFTSQSINSLALSGAYSSIYVSQSSNGAPFSSPAILPIQPPSHASDLKMTSAGGGMIAMVWNEIAPNSSQIRMVRFPETGLTSFLLSPQTVSGSGMASHPAVSYSAGTNTLVIAWVDLLQQKRYNSALKTELFLVTSPDNGITFTPPVNFSSPFEDSSDNPALINSGNDFFMVWQQQMPAAGTLPPNGEVFFSHF